MSSVEAAPVAHIEILDGGVVLTFGDGEGAFLSEAALHQAVANARLLPEFSQAELDAVAHHRDD
jgi:hypothetical protein